MITLLESKVLEINEDGDINLLLCNTNTKRRQPGSKILTRTKLHIKNFGEYSEAFNTPFITADIVKLKKEATRALE